MLVPLFRKRVVTASIGTYIHGYLCSRVCGMLINVCNNYLIVLSSSHALEQFTVTFRTSELIQFPGFELGVICFSLEGE